MFYFVFNLVHLVSFCYFFTQFHGVYHITTKISAHNQALCQVWRLVKSHPNGRILSPNGLVTRAARLENASSDASWHLGDLPAMLEGVGDIFGPDSRQYTFSKGLIRFLLILSLGHAVRPRHVRQRASFRMQMAMP